MSTSCPVCVKVVLNTDDGIGCDGPCDRWFHRECVSMNKTEYQRISGNTKLKWYCTRTDCVDTSNQPLAVLTHQMTSVLAKLDNLLGKINKIEEISRDVTDIKNEVATIRTGLIDLEPRVDRVEDRLSSLEKQITSSSPKDLETTIAELNERNRRSRNIMIYNLDESTAGDINSKKKHDLDLAINLFSPLLPNLSISGVKTFRVGNKKPDHPRPLKVVLNSQSDVITILRNFPDLAPPTDPRFTSVKLSRDRTPQETTHLRDLNTELKDRTSRGERDLTIKFINNTPQIVKSKKNE